MAQVSERQTLAPDLKKILLTEDEISKRVSELASEINEKYKDTQEPLILVGVLKGSFIFLSDLSRKLTIPHVVDFIAVSSYGSGGDKRGEVTARHEAAHLDQLLRSGSSLSPWIRG